MVSILLLAIFMIGAASAADVNVTDTTDDVLAVESVGEDAIAESTGTFSDLKTLVDNTAAGKTLNLDKDYLNDGNVYIQISKAITIDGKGHTLDANNASSIFKVSNNKVALKNINFINSMDSNSAVNGKCSIYNCSFVDCSAGGYGGAIEAGNAYNCSFVDCSAGYYGGAIYYGNAYNCSFVDCSAGDYGGAIYCGNAYNCSFVDCSAGDYGGAIYAYSYRTDSYGAYNCTFVNCSAYSGGAIFSRGITGAINAYNCTFLGCTADKRGTEVIYQGWLYNCTVMESPNLVISPEFIKSGEDFNITVTLSKNAAGNVRITLNNVTYRVKINSGKATLNIVDLANGTYDVIASYAGNAKCVAQTVSSTLYVGVKSYQGINVSVSGTTFGSDTYISVKTSQSATGYVHIIVQGTDYKVKINKGYAEFNARGIKSGSQKIIVKYGGNYRYLPEEVSTTFNVSKGTPISSVRFMDGQYGGNATVIVAFSKYVNGYAKIVVGSKVIRTQIIDNVATASFPGLKIGSYDVRVIYAGTSNYNPQTYEATLRVYQANPFKSIIVEDIGYGDNASISVKMAKNVNGNVRITVDGVTYVCKIVNGVAGVNVSGLNAGTYDVTARYAGSTNFYGQSITASFKVIDNAIISISAEDKYCGDDATITVKLAKNVNGNVRITVDGVTYVCKIVNGVAGVNVSGLKEGAYEVTARYAGNALYDAQTIKASFNVNKRSPNISATASANKGVTTFTALIDENVKGNVHFVVTSSGLTYTSLTAPIVNGVASIEVSSFRQGIEFYAYYAGSNNYRNQFTGTKYLIV